MNTIIKIPKETAQKGNLVLIPQSEYEEFLRFFKKRKMEEKDVDNAIKVFQKEKKERKLFKFNSFKELK